MSNLSSAQRIIGMWTQGEESETNPMKRLQETFTKINQSLKQGVPFTYSDPALSKTVATAHDDGEQASESEAMSKLLSKLGATSTQPVPPNQQQLSRTNSSLSASGETTPLAAKSVLSPPLTGASLLSSIFASALPQSQMQNSITAQPRTPPNPTPPPPPPITSEVSHIEPHSPRPQILTPGIIDAIMGVSPSRASNSASSDSAAGLGLGLGLGLNSILKRDRDVVVERGGLTPTPAASSTPFEGKHSPVPNGGSPLNSRATEGSQPLNKVRMDSKRNKYTQQPKGRALIPFEDESELWPYSRSSDGKPVSSTRKNREDWSYDADADAEDQNPIGHQSSHRVVSSFSRTPDGERDVNKKKREPVPIWDEVVTRPHGLPVLSSPSPGPAFGIASSGQRRRRREKVKEQYIPHNSPPSLNTANLPKGREMGKTQLQQILASSFLTNSTAKPNCDDTSDNALPNAKMDKVTTFYKRPESRNEFVRELLSLIHTDKEFVDELWEKYRDLAAHN
jgi:hypothetical protein